MSDPAFLNVKRQGSGYRPVTERIKDYREVALLRDEPRSKEQASRCINCGVPFCHWTCPIGNYIPEWNEHLANGRWYEAFLTLQAVNNIPEITGRICPASCEYACVLNLGEGSVTIRDDELAIIEHAFQAGYVQPHPPQRRTNRAVAVIGSGPAGLCCAAQLNQAGHRVVVFEQDDKPGGILRYGIPDFKLEKRVIDRRLDIWKHEGIEFIVNTNVGIDYTTSKLLKDFDGVCLAAGARAPRDLAIPGRDLKGIHFAMDYLMQSNRRVACENIPASQIIDARGKQVVVIGGGDTGSDCVGTAHRQGARKVIQVELLPKPPEGASPHDYWPDYPSILRSSSSNEEGGERAWSILTKRFIGAHGSVTKLSCVKLEWSHNDKAGGQTMKEIAGSEFEIETDLVLLAMGFVSPEKAGLLTDLKVQLDNRGNVATDEKFRTSIPNVFAAGDMHRGQSLVVWAIREGRTAAHHIDRYLMGHSDLPVLIVQ